MTRIIYIVAVLALAVGASCQLPYGHASSEESAVKYSPEELTDLFIAFKAIVERYGLEDGGSEESFEVVTSHLDFVAKLESSLKKLPDVHEMFGYPCKTFIVQSDLPGDVSGYPVENKGATDSGDRMLFVTTPVASLNNSMLAILSFTGPAHVSILQVDRTLGMTLVYDSMASLTPKTPICSIRSVTVKSPGVFVLEERTGDSCALDIQSYYLLDVSSGKVSVTELLPEPDSKCPE